MSDNSEKPVLGNKESDRDVDAETDNVTQQAPDRRRLFRKLLTLAGLGITGGLLSQEKAGLIPAVAGATMTIDAVNTGTAVTELDSSLISGIPAAAFVVHATSPAPADVNAIMGWVTSPFGTGVLGEGGATGVSGITGQGGGFGVQGVANSGTGVSGTGGVGVEGWGGGIGVLGAIAAAGNGIPMVAKGAWAQTANLQEWQNYGGSALSVVDKNGHFGIGTTSPSSMLSVGGVGRDIVGICGYGVDAHNIPVEGFDTAGVNGVYLRPNFSGCNLISSDYVSGSSYLPLSLSGRENTSDLVLNAGNVGIGTTSPQSHLFVVDSTTNPSRGVVASQNNSGPQAALMQMTKSRGSQTSPTAVLNGDYVAAFNMNAFDGTSYLGGKPMAGWGARVNGAVATGSIPTDLFFYTKPSGTLDPYGDGVVRVVISSAGNVGIGTTSPSHLIQLSGGAYSNGTTWVNASDRNMKENFTPLDENEILNRLETVPIQKWNYKNQPQAAHIGPVAQDFYAAYQLGDSEKSIGTVDAEGIAFAAIKALHKTMKELRTENEKLQARLQDENEKLQERIAILERTVKQFAPS